ncbi:MAG: DNA methyltransferase, partial [Candidatus Hermodarchaeota archaeon]|nr:DNA methyltransferase [Candidatus Hermodarchaeota archaeon]
NIAQQRLSAVVLNHEKSEIFCEDARDLSKVISENSIDLIITSPPYWDVHQQRRTADGKTPRPYTTSPSDMGNISIYSEFLKALGTVAKQLLVVLKPGHWCVLIVMDLRKKNKFYPFHIDCVDQWTAEGFHLEDIIIWDRRKEYHNLRPLGYPTTFRVNKIHEYILIFRKPL